MFTVNGLQRAQFISRPNRFIIHASYQGQELRCHLPNPGRMHEFFSSEHDLLIRLSDNPSRKTAATIMAIIMADEVIQLDSNLVARWLPLLIQQQQFPALAGLTLLKQEYTIGVHRFDYLLRDANGQDILMEVKSTTRVEHGIACFPDGVSARATSHAHALQQHVEHGGRAILLFMVFRSAQQFQPCRQVDPTFTRQLQQAYDAGVKVIPQQVTTSLLETEAGFSMHFSLSELLPFEL